MAYRGRGRGQGRGGFGSYRRGIPEPFILFPEDVVLPDINDVKEETALVVGNKKLQIYWKSSPYYLKKPAKKCGESDIKLYSKLKAEYLSAELFEECGENDIKLYSKLKKKYFPAELFEDADRLKFDDFIYREQNYEDRESKGENEKKKENENESDNEEQEDEEDEEDEEESSKESEGDYDKVENPDDDNDDYNQQEDDNPDDDNTYDG